MSILNEFTVYDDEGLSTLQLMEKLAEGVKEEIEPILIEESARKVNEIERKGNEIERKAEEIIRTGNEIERKAEEIIRTENEIEREYREEIRSQFYNGFSAQLGEIDGRIDNIIVTPAVGVSEQEILDARQGEGSLGTNISKVKGGIKELETSVIYPVASGGICDIDVPYESKNVTHPSVVHVPEKWNGKQYWMAVTGMPEVVENPMIFCSDDGANWLAPEGLINPVFPLSWVVSKGYVYNSDTSLTLINGLMWMLFRTVDNITFRETVWLTKSEDGVIWSDPVQLYTATSTNLVREILSPSLVVLPTGELAIFDVKYPPTNLTTEPPSQVRRRISTDNGVTWSAPVVCETPALHHSNPAIANLWHLEVRAKGGHLHMLGYAQTQRLHYWESLDGGLTWFGSRSPIFGDDHSPTRLFYRSSFQPSATGDGWDIWAADWPAKRIRLFRNVDLQSGASDVAMPRGIWLPAEQLSTSVGGLTTLMATGNGRLMGWRLAENAFGRVTGSIMRPVGWRRLRATIYWLNDGAGSGDVQLSAVFASYKPGEIPLTLGNAHDHQGTVSIVPAGVTGALMRTVMSTPGVDSYPGEFTVVMISRDGNLAVDTLENRIILLGVMIEPA